MARPQLDSERAESIRHESTLCNTLSPTESDPLHGLIRKPCWSATPGVHLVANIDSGVRLSWPNRVAIPAVFKSRGLSKKAAKFSSGTKPSSGVAHRFGSAQCFQPALALTRLHSISDHEDRGKIIERYGHPLHLRCFGLHYCWGSDAVLMSRTGRSDRPQTFASYRPLLWGVASPVNALRIVLTRSLKRRGREALILRSSDALSATGHGLARAIPPQPLDRRLPRLEQPAQVPGRNLMRQSVNSWKDAYRLLLV